MPSLSESEPPGCLSWIAAYCLGSYLMIPILLGDPEPLSMPQLMVLMPVVAPFVILAGFSLLSAYGGLGMAVAVMSCLMLIWGSLLIASLGVIRSVTDGVWAWWPAALIAGIYLLAAVWYSWLGG